MELGSICNQVAALMNSSPESQTVLPRYPIMKLVLDGLHCD